MVGGRERLGDQDDRQQAGQVGRVDGGGCREQRVPGASVSRCSHPTVCEGCRAVPR
ncbi:hypothetical protein FOVG_19584 [Fusarium oxysporum f. sp. pisi HDV247]|uniref:Uncharacterized protein n=1 Tax=Fusarium oxysporum f. sp. pisi HDV247 TaxID=1080344 RepID=W9N8A3_FUSOX|nr:hypothetical protein FOVG_19584 [Fusarium oxysporum f. sp. pisi HDV247]